jgi:hypothetical protein
MGKKLEKMLATIDKELDAMEKESAVKTEETTTEQEPKKD